MCVSESSPCTVQPRVWDRCPQGVMPFLSKNLVHVMSVWTITTKHAGIQYTPSSTASSCKSHHPCQLDYTHTHPFNGRFSGTTRVSQYQKGKTNLDFAEARDSEWQWHQLGHMQVCTSLQTDNHTSTPPLSFFYSTNALPAAQPTASKH